MKIAVAETAIEQMPQEVRLGGDCHLLSCIAEGQALKVRNGKLVEENRFKWLAAGSERRVGPIGEDCKERHRRMVLAQRPGEHPGERHEVLRDDGTDGDSAHRRS